MSEQRVQDAKLKDFEGPEFPQPLTRAQKRFKYHAERMHHPFLDAVAHALPHGRVKMHPRTSDRYIWIGSISFVFEDVQVKVLIPMMHDSDKKEGSYADRHLAMYTKHVKMDASFLRRAAETFEQAFNQTYRTYYNNAIRQSKEAQSS